MKDQRMGATAAHRSAEMYARGDRETARPKSAGASRSTGPDIAHIPGGRPWGVSRANWLCGWRERIQVGVTTGIDAGRSDGAEHLVDVVAAVVQKIHQVRDLEVDRRNEY
jgi:hypothetical protein